jgi:hypothetical protein
MQIGNGRLSESDFVGFNRWYGDALMIRQYVRYNYSASCKKYSVFQHSRSFIYLALLVGA